MSASSLLLRDSRRRWGGGGGGGGGGEREREREREYNNLHDGAKLTFAAMNYKSNTDLQQCQPCHSQELASAHCQWTETGSECTQILIH